MVSMAKNRLLSLKHYTLDEEVLVKPFRKFFSGSAYINGLTQGKIVDAREFAYILQILSGSLVHLPRVNSLMLGEPGVRVIFSFSNAEAQTGPSIDHELEPIPSVSFFLAS